MRTYLLVLSLAATALLCTVSSCKYSTEYQQVNAGNKFSVTVPSWMKQQDNLAQGAQFQYANRFRNFYAIGFATDKAPAKATLAEFLRTNTDTLKAHLTRPIVTDSVAVTIGGMPGARLEVLGKMDGEDIYFSEVFLEGRSRYYHLSVWTRNAERKLKFKEDINHILNSVKEI